MCNSSETKKILNGNVKERRGDSFKFRERTFLKKLIFVENALTYASLRNKLKNDFDYDTSRQYIYGVVSGRLNPSFEFATVLCKALGLRNVFTVFDQAEIYFPDFKTGDKIGVENDK